MSMILMLALLLQQVPALEEKASVDLPDAVLVEAPRKRVGIRREEAPVLAYDPKALALKASPGGRFVVRGRLGQLTIHEAETLKVVHELPIPWTAFGFDAKDAVLTVVGEDLRRYEAEGWKESSRHALPDASFREDKRLDPAGDGVVGKLKYLIPGQAFVTPDGKVHYRAKGGGLSVAHVEKEALITAVIVPPAERESFSEPVGRILGVTGQLLVASEGGLGMVVFRGKVFPLAASSQTIAAGLAGGRWVLVFRNGEGVYVPGTWKCATHFLEEQNACAAFDAAKGWVYVGGPEGLRVWNSADRKAVHPFEGVGPNVRQVEFDGERRVLYTLQDTKFRRWKVAD